MGDIPGLVKISVSLKIQPNDGAVYFKVDGQRFGQNRTIKLLTGAKYKIEVVLRPGTVQATTMGIGGVNVPLEEKSRDAQVVSYTGIYDTEGVPHTKSGERQPIQVNMQDTTDIRQLPPRSLARNPIPSPWRTGASLLPASTTKYFEAEHALSTRGD
ncbi:CB1 cannabinoid receptor-interacting protein 1 isoform X2 [Lathamus discolor]|uniref:CB1 cannabinoid receptor-interacting protein 1 isoform X2 n=1 Tax=Lathamus discolor TaxID=678569 RepID=UPI0032B7DC48